MLQEHGFLGSTPRRPTSNPSIMHTSTLLLDQAYRPHAVITWQRAVVLLTLGAVEVVESYDEEIHSVSFVMKLPAVVRLLRRIRGTKSGVKFSRINILTRDHFTCQFCGRKVSFGAATYDHVVPRSQGGVTNWTNIVTSCKPCNDRKADRTPERAGMRLRSKPVKPDWLPLTMLRLPRGTRVPDAWATFLYWKGSLDEDTATS